MSTSLTPDPTSESSRPGPRTKTLSVKNVPHSVWQRARQNTLASNLSFAEYVVQILANSGPHLSMPGVELKDGRAEGNHRAIIGRVHPMSDVNDEIERHQPWGNRKSDSLEQVCGSSTSGNRNLLHQPDYRTRLLLDDLAHNPIRGGTLHAGSKSRPRR